MYDFDSICESYFKWLTYNLSDIGIVDEDDVSNEINKLIPKKI